MTKTLPIDDNNIDDHVDDEIAECLSLSSPKSFFLFAGAGSGKTRSLVEALKRFREKSSRQMRIHGQKVGVITYTNNACDEIKHRLNFDPLIEVSTIHSFVWTLISGFNSDIKIWLQENLKSDIEVLKQEQIKGRAGTKAALDRTKSIESKTKRLDSLSTIKQFTYSPSGENRGRDSLNHAEVISIGVNFLNNKNLMKQLLIRKFPILLIDESQDTNKELMEALLQVQQQHSANFTLGLLGDTMQRIYADGKPDLGIDLPKDWKLPAKKMNHRCPKRVVKLINKIREDVDRQSQRHRTDKEEGFVRLFIVSSSDDKKPEIEAAIQDRMAEITRDKSWTGENKDVKTLILEHHMAAKRMGFLPLYEPLYKNQSLRVGLLDGSLSGLKLFSEIILPFVRAKKTGDDFAVMSQIKKFSPLLDKKFLKASGENQLIQIERAREAAEVFWKIFQDNPDPTFIEVLYGLSQTNLFDIPESLKPISTRSKDEQKALVDLAANDEAAEEDKKSVLDSWDEALATPFSQIEKYAAYINGEASFDTHQGVKGLEFDRVMVIIDDNEARGFLFGYEKLLGAKEKSDQDLKNEKEGKDTTIARTRRLLYVTCSRAEESLAIVVYSQTPKKIVDFVVGNDWFTADEIVTIDNKTTQQ